MINQNPL